MRKIIFFAALTLINVSRADFENNKKVRELLNQGNPQITKNAKECENSHNGLTDRLGEKKRFSNFCTKLITLPENVLEEIITMKKYADQNLSDYDQRVTRLYVLKHNKQYLDSKIRLDETDAKDIAKAINIEQSPRESSQMFSPTAYIVRSEKDLSHLFSGLYVGNEFKNKTHILNFVTDLLKHQIVLQVTIGSDGVELYPGGGLEVKHILLVTKEFIIYLKMANWNS